MNPKPIVFPRDHGAHETIIEWWYFNGNLTDKEGNQYSFMDCLFKANIKNSNIPYLKHLSLEKFFKKEHHAYFAHSVVSDITRQKNYKEIQDVSMVSGDSFKKERLFINYIDPIILRGYVDNEIVEVDRDVFHVKNKYIQLTLTSSKPALLEGGNGYVKVCDRESYYYSLTQLKTTGILTIEGKEIAVEGVSWMDHQWADTPYRHDRWTWFSIQLENGTDLMCCEYVSGTKKEYVVDVINATHHQSHYQHLILKAGDDVWKSKATKAAYPMSWDIEIPEHDTVLHITSRMSDQEFISMSINYWEGPIEVSGMIKGAKVTGVGFMELVGYPSDFSHLLSLGKDIRNELLGK